MAGREGYTRLDLGLLRTTLQAGPPDNDARDEGYALVNVATEAAFERAHIPGSIGIPAERLDEFGERYGPEKKIIVYCESHDCPASRETALRLAERGFQHVFDFEGGIREWKEAGDPVEGAAA